jgi:cell division protein FtsL
MAYAFIVGGMQNILYDNFLKFGKCYFKYIIYVCMCVCASSYARTHAHRQKHTNIHTHTHTHTHTELIFR